MKVARVLLDDRFIQEAYQECYPYSSHIIGGTFGSSPFNPLPMGETINDISFNVYISVFDSKGSDMTVNVAMQY